MSPMRIRAMIGLNDVQSFMRAKGIDLWVLYDFRGGNPVFWQLLEGKRSTTRRSFLIVPEAGVPTVITHAIELHIFASLPLDVVGYASKHELDMKLSSALEGTDRVAMEYSPKGELPTASWVDGGTLELVRSFGVEVVSSADLFQVALTNWGDDAYRSHLHACEGVASVKDAAFSLISSEISEQRLISEFGVQQFMLKLFGDLGLETDHGPIVAVNANSGNPHYEPSAITDRAIKKEDWVLIDLWARVPGETNVYADITWVGYVGDSVPLKMRELFGIVVGARDAVVEKLQRNWKSGRYLQGWELDDVARQYIDEAGYGQHFVHRTGHSLGTGPSVHGLGVNLDNLETHDTRELLPGAGFTIEPGIYTKEFGVRVEINVYVHPVHGPQITTPVQRDIELLK